MTQSEMTVHELDMDILARLRRTERISRAAAEINISESRANMERDAIQEIERLRAECDRLARRNTMLIKELEERGRKFTPEQLQRAIVKAMYETEG
jgi:hypothetical protein